MLYYGDFFSNIAAMQKSNHQLFFEAYSDIKELSNSDASLLTLAQSATSLAYAPYSKFKVGAAARLSNGETLKGSNQENASFPAGICAERVLLSACSSLFSGVPIEAIAISYLNDQDKSNRPIAPCGICRQSLLEYENFLKHPIRLILGGFEGKIIVIPKASDLLPFAFTNDDLF